MFQVFMFHVFASAATILPMDPSDPETVKLLTEARSKAEHLLSELLKNQAEVEANPPDLPPDKLEQGRHALQKAIESARRMLKGLDEAQQIAAIDMN
jgi:hypothetical protein